MKTTIETLATARQVNREGITYVEDANCTVVRDENEWFVTNHNFKFESKRFKSFRSVLKYIYE
jgi:hypothetical protein